MFVVRILSHRGRSVASQRGVGFPAAGGTIGRSEECTLTLADASRHISRVHARLEPADDGPRILCLGAGLPLILNGRELVEGESSGVRAGDRIVLGDYELELGSPEDQIEIGKAGPRLSPADAPDAAPHPRASEGVVNPFDFRPPSGESPATPRLPDASELPADHPLAPPVAAAAPASDRLRIGGFGGVAEDLGRQQADGIDAIFGLDHAQAPRADPLGPAADPLGLAPTRDAGTPPSDAGDALHGTFRLPEAALPADFGVEAEQGARESSTRPTEDPPPFMWPSEVRVAAEKAVADQPQWEMPPRTSPTSFIERNNAAQKAALGTRGSAIASVPDHSRDGDFELLKALVLGLGMTELPRGKGAGAATPRVLTPELMRRIGELLRAASDGTVELLRARATVKREMRAEVTGVLARDNNPLKFAPDGLAALEQLLAAHPVRGFMDAVPAMRDAYDDLQAHQLAFVAGMRAALQGLMANFDPRSLEQRLMKRTVVESVVPAARRARLWELFVEMYDEVSHEAQDDFDALFTREFVRAYEEQLDKLDSRSGESPRD
jgi:type VI secretion system FHA domain protein